MKILYAILILVFSHPISASAQSGFSGRIYTPEVVTDVLNQGKKGAVQLVWQKMTPRSQYEIEVSNGTSIYRKSVQVNFAHIMLYFNKDYKWRVRELSQEKRTQFSDWHPLTVIRGSSKRHMSSMSIDNVHVEELFIDHGGK